jgi:hypothetical protein
MVRSVGPQRDPIQRDGRAGLALHDGLVTTNYVQLILRTEPLLINSRSCAV